MKKANKTKEFKSKRKSAKTIEGKRGVSTFKRNRDILCERLNFDSAEAYKLLRTNLQFSLPDVQGCKVIGVTSAIRGEGKTTTAINISYMLAEAGKQVLLMEGDLRLPNIARRLGLQSEPGLADHLGGLTNAICQSLGIQKNLCIISAGNEPPNPSELLGSMKMETCLKKLKESFDYIIIDLPPVNVVSDGLALARLIDGYVMVVRQDYSSRSDILDAVSKIETVEGELLGFVFNSVDNHDASHRYNRYKYYHNGYGYGGGYNNDNRVHQNNKHQNQT